MTIPSIGKLPAGDELKEIIRSLALAAGFIRPRFLAPFDPGALVSFSAPVSGNYRQGAPSLLVCALVYGNQGSGGDQGPKGNQGSGGDREPGQAPAAGDARIAPFAQRNYYREGVKRLRLISRELRARYGGEKRDFRVLCNSPIPEKPLAAASGLGFPGRNGLILTAEAGSLFIIAAMTLPFALESDGPEKPGPFPLCAGCGGDKPPCAAACPTGALRGDGTMVLERCIQWYASGKGATVPPEVAARWGGRLYGCTECQDGCILNRRPIPGVDSEEGPLPAAFPAAELLALSDGEIKARFQGTALGLSWLGPEAIRRNARLAGGQGSRV